jgi:hypothetical protein
MGAAGLEPATSRAASGTFLVMPASIRSGGVADEWVDRCPVCNAGFAEIGVMGREKPVEVLCAGPEKHFFPVLEKRRGDPTPRYRLGDRIEHPTDGVS